MTLLPIRLILTTRSWVSIGDYYALPGRIKPCSATINQRFMRSASPETASQKGWLTRF